MLGILILGVIGLGAGLLLAISAVVFATPKDEKMEAVLEILPGVNCGACGYSGCEGYAKSLSNNEAKNGLCTPGGEDVILEIANILGENAKEFEKKIAVVKCQGISDHVSKKMHYTGIDTCQAANVLYKGDSACNYGCLGRGDCATICPEDAISIKKQLAIINLKRCIGCGLCEKKCPKGIIEILPEKFSQHVRCKNTDKGALTRKVCTVGCIGCMKCKKVCENGAIKIENFCAVMDYQLCTNCHRCKEVCPMNTIA